MVQITIQPIFILVDEEADIKAFANYKGESAEQPKQPKQAEPKEKEQPKEQKTEHEPKKVSGGAHFASDNIRGHHRENVLSKYFQHIHIWNIKKTISYNNTILQRHMCIVILSTFPFQHLLRPSTY